MILDDGDWLKKSTDVEDAARRDMPTELGEKDVAKLQVIQAKAGADPLADTDPDERTAEELIAEDERQRQERANGKE